ncbi:exported hypothetical protein [Agrobacterium fabrum str. J-07]|nr:exported hypothetical protein [Agrobacterium fabrum str. J-07]
MSTRSPAWRDTMAIFARSPGSVGAGAFVLMMTALLPSASTLARLRMKPPKPLGLFGTLPARPSVKITSSEVKGWPSCDLTPSRRLDAISFLKRIPLLCQAFNQLTLGGALRQSVKICIAIELLGEAYNTSPRRLSTIATTARSPPVYGVISVNIYDHVLGYWT